MVQPVGDDDGHRERQSSLTRRVWGMRRAWDRWARAICLRGQVNVVGHAVLGPCLGFFSAILTLDRGRPFRMQHNRVFDLHYLCVRCWFSGSSVLYYR